jgi:hypothetical protein
MWRGILMTNKKDNDKVKPIRKGIKVEAEPEEEKLEPNLEIVNKLKDLLVQAESGEMRELIFITVNEDNSSRHGMVGEPWNFLLVQNLLKILSDIYYDSITYPNLTGHFDGIDWEEGE